MGRVECHLSVLLSRSVIVTLHFLGSWMVIPLRMIRYIDVSFGDPKFRKYKLGNKFFLCIPFQIFSTMNLASLGYFFTSRQFVEQQKPYVRHPCRFQCGWLSEEHNASSGSVGMSSKYAEQRT